MPQESMVGYWLCVTNQGVGWCDLFREPRTKAWEGGLLPALRTWAGNRRYPCKPAAVVPA
jgi:hypothetical protein